MRLDKNHYADTISDELLPNKIFETSALMVNQSSGYDIQYQYNKVHNLKLAGKAINKVLIRPKETFSFYWLVRNADKKEPYKDGLNLVDGKIIGSYGGGTLPAQQPAVLVLSAHAVDDCRASRTRRRVLPFNNRGFAQRNGRNGQ